MSVFETLKMFAYLRGLKKKIAYITCLSLLDIFDLNEHKDKMCCTLSGGNRRKLSVAISFIGSPNIIILDEPTS